MSGMLTPSEQLGKQKNTPPFERGKSGRSNTKKSIYYVKHTLS